MKEKFTKWMQGRYGADQLTNTIIYLAVLILIGGLFTKSKVPSFIALTLVIYANIRVMSKNIYQRTRENTIFLEKTKGLRSFFSRTYLHIFGRDGYKYFTCDQCKTELRIPKNKGKIKVRCPKCKKEHIKRT